MSQNFRVEDSEVNSERIRVYSKDKDSLPLKKDWDHRFGIHFAHADPVLDDIHNFEVRPDDVWLVVHPKCGTTWMSELLWLLMNNLDFRTASTVDQEERCKIFEYCAIFPTLKPHSLELIQSWASPRFIRTHLPMHMLPKGLWTVKPKIVYVARDPKDATVSLYHHMRGLGKSGTLEDYAARVMADEVVYDPFWQHILEFWSIRDQPNVLFTSFERMKMDLKSVVEKVADHLGKNIDAEDMKELLKYLSFDHMKNTRTCNHEKETEEIREVYGAENTPFQFIRKGKVGSAKEELSAKSLEKFAEWTEENLKPYGVTMEEVLLK